MVRGDQAPAHLQPHAYLRAGDRIRTSAGARAAFALLPNALVELGESAELRILELSLTKDGNETGDAILRRTVRCELVRGALVVSQEEEPEITAALQLVLETNAGAVSSNFETVSRLDVSELRTRVLCGSGTISFAPKVASSGVTLKPGETGEWSPTGATLGPSDTDARSQTELTEMLDRALELRRRRDESRLHSRRHRSAHAAAWQIFSPQARK